MERGASWDRRRWGVPTAGTSRKCSEGQMLRVYSPPPPPPRSRCLSYIYKCTPCDWCIPVAAASVHEWKQQIHPVIRGDELSWALCPISPGPCVRLLPVCGLYAPSPCMLDCWIALDTLQSRLSNSRSRACDRLFDCLWTATFKAVNVLTYHPLYVWI